MDTAITFSVPINGHVAYGWVRPGKGWHVASDVFPEDYTRTEPPTLTVAQLNRDAFNVAVDLSFLDGAGGKSLTADAKKLFDTMYTLVFR